MPTIWCLHSVWEKVTGTEAPHGHMATKLLTWQMNILIPITGLCKWNAFIFPYLQAHVFLFLISWNEKPFFFSCYLVPSKGSGAQLQTPKAAVTLRLPAAEILSKEWQVESIWIHSHS